MKELRCLDKKCKGKLKLVVMEDVAWYKCTKCGKIYELEELKERK